jgi:hypothetical protein
MRLNQAMDRRLAAIEGKVNPPKTRTVAVWRDVYGEDKSDQTIADMRADGRLTDQDRLLICSWRRACSHVGDDFPSEHLDAL